MLRPIGPDRRKPAVPSRSGFQAATKAKNGGTDFLMLIPSRVVYNTQNELHKGAVPGRRRCSHAKHRNIEGGRFPARCYCRQPGASRCPTPCVGRRRLPGSQRQTQDRRRGPRRHGRGLCGRLQGRRDRRALRPRPRFSPRRCSRSIPSARLYKDFRQMFDKEHKNFDALIVATPDHWHSHLVLAGLAMNKHIYCAKPITHTIAEARKVKAAASPPRSPPRRAFRIRAPLCPGHHGVAVDRGHRPDSRSALLDRHPRSGGGLARPEAQTPPEGMNWDQWCGPSPARPYHKIYHYGNWRPGGTSARARWATSAATRSRCSMTNSRWGRRTGSPPIACQAFSLADGGSVNNTECMSIANTIQWHIPARGKHPEMMAYLL